MPVIKNVSKIKNFFLIKSSQSVILDAIASLERVEALWSQAEAEIELRAIVLSGVFEI